MVERRFVRASGLMIDVKREHICYINSLYSDENITRKKRSNNRYLTDDIEEVTIVVC